MFTNQRENRTHEHIVAMVELDVRSLRIKIVFAREAIDARIRELEHATDYGGEWDFEDATHDRSRSTLPGSHDQ